MRMIWGILLLVAPIAAGCANSQLHQSLLMQENRQLENALYVAHAQVADLKRENDLLRTQQADGLGEPSGRPYTGSLDDVFDLAPPFETPKVILPSTPGTSEVPESLKGSQMIPIWRPRR